MTVNDLVQLSAEAIVRFATFFGQAFLFGFLPIFVLVLRPVMKVPHPEHGRRLELMSIRIEGLVRAALGALFVGLVGLVVLQAVAIAELQSGSAGLSVIDSLVASSYGRWLVLRLLLVVALGVLLVGKVRDAIVSAGSDRSGRRALTWWALWGVIALCLVMATSFSGHASAASPRLLSIPNDVVHLVAGSTWLTGILCLTLIVPFAWKDVDEAHRTRLYAPAVSNFSRIALVCILVLSATGVINCFFHLGTLGDLASTSYGRTLSTKLFLFLPILALGAVNHLLLRKRLERQAAEGGAGSARRWLRRTVVIELVFGIAIMGATAHLTNLPRTKDLHDVIVQSDNRASSHHSPDR